MVLVIIIVAVLVAWSMGLDPAAAIALILGAGLAGARVARTLTAGGAAAQPESGSGPSALSA